MAEFEILNQNQFYEEPTQRVQEIKKTIKELEKEVESIQGECLHNEYEVKNCPTENKSFCLKKVCKNCHKDLGYPSQEEINKWTQN
jgi:peptidoglycan hydrolase CwlO-like protein